MYKKVFISYAKEDIEYAFEIFEFLLENKYDPWLDKKCLKVGQDWDFYIKKELRESDFIILLLSNVSIQKRGYVQREYKLALDYAQEKLNTDIYIIPILIDDCSVPEELSKYQWERFDTKGMLEKILVSLNYQREIYLNSTPNKETALNDYTEKSLKLGLDLTNNINFTCKVPLFKENKFFDSEFMNSYVDYIAYNFISEFRKFLLEDNYLTYKGKQELDNYSIEINYYINYLTPHGISILFNSYSNLGGPYPNTEIRTLNVLFYPNRQTYLTDILIIDDLEEFLKLNIKKFVKHEVLREIMISNLSYVNEKNLDFLVNTEDIEILLHNHLPHVAQIGSSFKIPFENLNFKNG